MLRFHQMQEVTSVQEPCCSFGSRFASYVSCMQYTNPYLAGRREHVHFHRHSRARVMPCAYKLGSLRFLCSSLAALLIKRVRSSLPPKWEFSDPWIVSSSPTATLPMGVSGRAVTQIVKTTHVSGAIACFAVSTRLLRQRTEQMFVFGPEVAPKI